MAVSTSTSEKSTGGLIGMCIPKQRQLDSGKIDTGKAVFTCAQQARVAGFAAEHICIRPEGSNGNANHQMCSAKRVSPFWRGDQCILSGPL